MALCRRFARIFLAKIASPRKGRVCSVADRATPLGLSAARKAYVPVHRVASCNTRPLTTRGADAAARRLSRSNLVFGYRHRARLDGDGAGGLLRSEHKGPRRARREDCAAGFERGEGSPEGRGTVSGAASRSHRRLAPTRLAIIASPMKGRVPSVADRVTPSCCQRHGQRTSLYTVLRPATHGR